MGRYLPAVVPQNIGFSNFSLDFPMALDDVFPIEHGDFPVSHVSELSGFSIRKKGLIAGLIKENQWVNKPLIRPFCLGTLGTWPGRGWLTSHDG